MVLKSRIRSSYSLLTSYAYVRAVLDNFVIYYPVLDRGNRIPPSKAKPAFSSRDAVRLSSVRGNRVPLLTVGVNIVVFSVTV